MTQEDRRFLEAVQDYASEKHGQYQEVQELVEKRKPYAGAFHELKRKQGDRGLTDTGEELMGNLEQDLFDIEAEIKDAMADNPDVDLSQAAKNSAHAYGEPMKQAALESAVYGENLSHDSYEEAKDAYGRAKAGAKETAEVAAADMQDTYRNVRDGAKQTIDVALEDIADDASTAAERIGDVYEAAEKTAGTAASDMWETVENIVDAAHAPYEDVKDLFGGGGNQHARGQAMADGATRFFNDNPDETAATDYDIEFRLLVEQEPDGGWQDNDTLLSGLSKLYSNKAVPDYKIEIRGDDVEQAIQDGTLTALKIDGLYGNNAFETADGQLVADYESKSEIVDLADFNLEKHRTEDGDGYRIHNPVNLESLLRKKQGGILSRILGALTGSTMEEDLPDTYRIKVQGVNADNQLLETPGGDPLATGYPDANAPQPYLEGPDQYSTADFLYEAHDDWQHFREGRWGQLLFGGTDDENGNGGQSWFDRFRGRDEEDEEDHPSWWVPQEEWADNGYSPRSPPSAAP